MSLVDDVIKGHVGPATVNEILQLQHREQAFAGPSSVEKTIKTNKNNDLRKLVYENVRENNEKNQFVSDSMEIAGERQTEQQERLQQRNQAFAAFDQVRDRSAISTMQTSIDNLQNSFDKLQDLVNKIKIILDKTKFN